MSRFEVRVTPTRVKVARKRDEAREPTVVTMAPFSAKAIVTFEDIPVGKVARRVLLVENPTALEGKFLVTKTCKPEYNIALEWTSCMIEGSSNRTLEIVWNPPKAVACREVIQLTDSRGFRKDVAVILKSLEPRKGIKKPLKVQNAAVPKKTKTKTPTPPRQAIRKTAFTPDVVVKYKAKSPHLRKMISPQKKIRSGAKNKENQQPVTPPNTSGLFDQIHFTPVTETKPAGTSYIDYLASLPTPVAVTATAGKRFLWSPSDQADQVDQVVVQPPPPPSRVLQPIGEDYPRLSTETYITGNISPKDSFEVCPEIHKTFDVTKKIEVPPCGSNENLSRQIDEIVLTPLRKIITSESMKNLSGQRGQSKEQEFLKLNQGSMPNLHEIEKINSIESNRYFFAGTEMPPMGALDERPSTFAFNASEIRAQSSRVNLNEEEEPEVSPIPAAVAKSVELFKVPMLKRNRDQLGASNGEVRSSLMTLSPPKKYRPDDICSARASSADGLSVKTWSRYQPKKLKPLTLIKLPRTPKKEEASITSLYDPKLLRSVVNPDPFAASTTCDPFLSATTFLDDEAVEKHEKHFKKWLNALVTVPEELDGADQKIDVARLFNEVKNKELTLAPTKESVSAKYFIKYRLENLRKAASELYQSEGMQKVLSYVTVLVEKKQLTIQQNRDLHRDLALQRQILELIFCFNPLWLRIGLEVVFNEKIELNSNRDIHGLTNFILNRLFRNKALEKKGNRNYTHTAEYGEKIKKFTLKQMLHLIYLLDRAKECRIIRHNPCLFVKQAPWKESGEVMKQLTSLLVTNVGDILRYLKRIGYVLEHKQTYIDEFDYAFGNLATDLRDGIRLTRVMEVILMREDLSKNLRYPAISLLQKRHNAELALSALTEADFVIAGNITGKDIAEGHREKTLSLLWQIIYKFRAPKFNAAATTIQQWWRNSWLKVVIARRIAYRKEMVRHQAATVIQSAIRGFLVRRAYREFREERIVATVIIQTYYRRYAAEKKYKKLRGAVICVQQWWRSVQDVRRDRAKFHETRAAVIKIQNWFRRVQTARKLEAVARVADARRREIKLLNASAIVIQRAVKSYLIHKRLRDTVDKVMKFNRHQKLENNAATKIQSYWRMRRARRSFQTILIAALTIQRFWRMRKLAHMEREDFLAMRKAAIAVQRQWRAQITMKTEKSKFIILKQATIVIQQHFRALKAMRSSRKSFQELKAATLTVQRKFRANCAMKTTRKSFLALKAAAVTIQRRFRARKLMLKQQFEFICLRESTITIQRFFRGYQSTKIQRKEFVALKEATIVLQRRFRANRSMVQHRNEFQQLKSASITIQRRFRATRAMQNNRKEFLQIKNAVLVIQRHFRATKLMKIQRIEFVSYQYSCTVIQQHFRGWRMMRTARREFLQIKSAAVTIQRRFRAQKSMKMDRKEFQEKKKAALCLQTWWRASVAMKTSRRDFLKLKEVTIKVQRAFRAKKLMQRYRNEFQLLLKAAVVVQRSWRAKVAMRKANGDFKQLKQATINLQRRFRAKKAMALKKKEYAALKLASEIIQRKWRATLMARNQREEFLRMKKAALVIQKRFRATLLMRECREDYLAQKKASLIITQRWRATLMMRRERKTYIEVRQKIVNLQMRWRATLQMRAERRNFEILKKATLVIQRRFRAKKAKRIARIAYIELQYATIVIQRRFRALKMMKKAQQDFRQLSQATILIQKRFRERKLAHLQRKSFLEKKSAATVIQKHFRSFLLMRRQREEYHKIHNAIVTVQRRYRARLEMRKIRCQYLLIKSLIVCLQRKFRAKMAMKRTREEFLQLKNVTISVQRRFREKMKTRQLREEFEVAKRSIVKIQALARGYLARKRFEAMMTPEAVEMRRRIKAAKTIQSVWRGYVTRKKKQTRSMREIAEKIVNTRKTAKSADTVRQHLKKAMLVLKGRFGVHEISRMLEKMENLSRTVPHILIPDAPFVARFCCSVMADAIRSEPHKLIIESCARVMLNLARYEHTVELVFLPDAFTIIAQMLLRWCDKKCEIFNTLCTLIWVFIQDPKKNQKIREFMVTRDAVFMLREIRKLVLRKENMKRNTQRGLDSMQQISGQSLRKLPTLKPDYGVIRNQIYVFNCSVFAFDTILSKMQINLAP